MRNCGCCKFKELSPAEFPCCDCGAGNHWEAEEEEEVKLCVNCIFRDREISEEPCASCTTYKNWQSDTKIRCGTCQFMDKGINEDPCDSCGGGNNWLPKKEESEPEPVDISEMKVVNLDDGFSVLYGYGGMKILQQGTVLTDIYNPAIRAVLYKLIKKLEEEK